MAEFTIREATEDDKEDVLGIHDNVYDGRDYLSGFYDDFIRSPLTKAYVACLDGKIVGFIATFNVDDGETAATRSGRLSPRVGGHGLYKKLQNYALRASGARIHCLTAVNANPGTKKDSFNVVNKHILTKPFVRFLFDARDIPINTDVCLSLKGPSKEDLTSYMTDEDFKSYLFPSGRILVDWVPYRLLSSNVDLLVWSEERTKVASDVAKDANGQCQGLLTFSTTFPVPKPGFGSNLDIYGSDTRTLKDHMVYHLRHIRELTKGVTSLLVYTEPEFDVEKLLEVFGDFGLLRSHWHEPGDPERVYSRQMLFEKEII